MKQYVFSIAILFCVLALSKFLSAQSLQMDWLGQFTSTWAVSSQGVVKDTAGNTYVSGDFSFTTDFDQGPGKMELTAVGNSDIFLAKLDDKGEIKWVVSEGLQYPEHNTDIALDPNGNPFLVGYIDHEGFLAKFSPLGNKLLEIRQIPLGNGYSGINAIGVDELGNIITGGTFKGSVDFDPDTGQYIMDGGTNESFVAKYTPDGHFLWAREVNKDSAGSANYGEALAIDEAGSIYFRGHGFGKFDLNPDSSGQNIYKCPGSQGFQDLFLIKLDKNGNHKWSFGFGSVKNDFDEGYVSVSGNSVYQSGYLSGSADFDPGPRTDSIVSTITYGFLHKLDTSGNHQWVIQSPGIGSVGRAMKSSKKGFIYWCTKFSTPITLNTLTDTLFMNPSGDFDHVLLKLNPSGDFIWGLHIHKGMGLIEPEDLYVDSTGTIVIAGNYTDTTDFICHNDSIRRIPQNHWDAYIQHISDTNNNVIPPIPNSILEMNSPLKITVYPNPTAGNFAIQYSFPKNCTLTVFNNLGESVYSEQIVNEKTEIDLPSILISGIYFVRITDSEKISTHKLILQR